MIGPRVVAVEDREAERFLEHDDQVAGLGDAAQLGGVRLRVHPGPRQEDQPRRRARRGCRGRPRRSGTSSYQVTRSTSRTPFSVRRAAAASGVGGERPGVAEQHDRRRARARAAGRRAGSAAARGARAGPGCAGPGASGSSPSRSCRSPMASEATAQASATKPRRPVARPRTTVAGWPLRMTRPAGPADPDRHGDHGGAEHQPEEGQHGAADCTRLPHGDECRGASARALPRRAGAASTVLGTAASDRRRTPWPRA